MAAFSQRSVNGTAANSKHLTDLRHSHVTLFVESLRGAQFVGGETRRASSGTTTSTRRGQAGIGAFTDEVTLKLCQGSKDVEHEPATGRTGVDILLQGVELDALLLQRVHVVNQVTAGPPQSVQPPDHKSVPGANLVQELIELWPWLKGAGGSVCKDAIATGLGQCIVLELCVLVACGNSGVSEEVSHGSKCINTRLAVIVSMHSL